MSPDAEQGRRRGVRAEAGRPGSEWGKDRAPREAKQKVNISKNSSLGAKCECWRIKIHEVGI